ncbi:MAG: HEPN domain-containing protein [Spirochaetaceae bacterium]|nr:HEPN domain-containing protein [Spirochaetaceae bacterium]
MTGRAEVARQRRQLDTTFARARDLHADVELLSDFARYLCVLVSGYVEQTTIELLIEYARTHSDPRIQRHVERGVRQVTNLNSQRLIDVVGTMDPAWRSELEDFIVDEYKDALDGIVALRNSVAHGRYVGVTLSRATDYYTRVKKIIDRVADLVIP